MSTTPIRRFFIALARAGRKIFAHPSDAALSVRLALWIVLTSVLARLTTLARVQKIASFKIRFRAVQPEAGTAARLGRLIDNLLAIDLFVFRPCCWKRALVLHRYLALNGIESQIRFGLRKESEGRVDGHAWLEHDGRPLLEENAANYVVTFSLPADRSPTCHSAGYR